MSKASEMISLENHTVEGKLVKTQVLKCTHRGCKSRTRTSKPATPDTVIALARQKGWNINLANKTAICPNHGVEKPREMNREQKRVIWREIDDNYDHNRYIPGVTDKSIGEKLNFPWAWVKQVREDDFGPAGEDPVLAKINSQLKDLEAKVSELGKIGFRCAEQAEELNNEITLLKGRMTTLLKKS